MPKLTLTWALLFFYFLAAALYGVELHAFVASFGLLPEALPWQYVLLWSSVPLGAASM